MAEQLLDLREAQNGHLVLVADDLPGAIEGVGMGPNGVVEVDGMNRSASDDPALPAYLRGHGGP